MFRIMRMQSVYSFCKEDGVPDKTIQFFFIYALLEVIWDTKYSSGSMTFCLPVLIYSYTAFEDTYALLFMHIASCLIILCSEGKAMLRFHYWEWI